MTIAPRTFSNPPANPALPHGDTLPPAVRQRSPTCGLNSER
jgi:hypothetical protein